MGPTSLSLSARVSNLLVVFILVIVVDPISSSLFKFINKGKSDPIQPLYGVILHGHPYPNRIPSVPSPYSSYSPFYPNPPVYLPNIQQRPQVYHQPPPHVYPPPGPAVAQQLNYKPPTINRPTLHPSVLVNRPTPYPVQPTLPVPTTFDVKPWRPLYDSITSASYVLNPAVQLNTVDGYPWTEELRDGPDTKFPETLFYPNKPLAQQHAANSNVEFNPHPERLPSFDNRLTSRR